MVLSENYLQDLISEAKNRGGGIVLNSNDKPELVVLTIDRYNQLLAKINQQPSEDQVLENQITQTQETKTILVTGGAGYIGSHAARELLKNGFKVIIIDNLSTGLKENLPEGALFFEGDIADTNFLHDIFANKQIYAVMHFAASLEVGESVKFPDKYLKNNVLNTANLLSVMKEYGVNKIIFSSTAAVYGEQEIIPIPENAKLKPDNPYGFSKVLTEKIIKYYCQFLNFHAIIFRYFNACGTDFDGKIKSSYNSHIIPTVLKVASGEKPYLEIFGHDYNTADGTCVRDYVHVLDIARAHVLAVSALEQDNAFNVYNIGTGKGHSVREIINTASEILNKIIPMEISQRRPGDAAITVANNQKIISELKFNLQYSDLETIIKTSWNQKQLELSAQKNI